MIDWEEESIATQDVLTKQLIDTVGIIVLAVVVLAVLCFI